MRNNLFLLQLTILCASHIFISDAQAMNDEPCEATIIDRGYIQPSNGIYGCTVRKHNNGIITAWMWHDDSALLSKERYRVKYAFQCAPGLVKLLENYSGAVEEDWVRAPKDTVAQKWLSFICKNAKYY